MTAIKLLSTLAVMGAMRDLTALYETRTGIEVEAEFAPTAALLDRLRTGQPADLAILTAQGIDDLIRDGVIRPGTRTDIAVSFIGVACKAGAPKPDIASVAAFTTAMLAARSVAYSKIGASGIYFASLIEHLGIAGAVNARAIIVPTGFTAERVVSGEAELAVQQISELLVVPGIEIVGPLPAEIQTAATFSAGLPTAATQPGQAAALIRFLASPEIAEALRRAGLQPAAG